MKIVAGIDVSGETLELAILDSEFKLLKSKTCPNIAEGHRQICRLVKKCDSVVLEATGSYHVELVKALISKGVKVCVVNPARAKLFAEFNGGKNKTDPLDARMLAKMGHSSPLEEFTPLDEAVEVFRRLVRMRQDIVRKTSTVQTQLKDPAFKAEAEQSLLKEQLALLTKQRKKIEESIRAWVSERPEISKSLEDLRSINGVGEAVSWTYLAETGGFLRFASAKSVSAYAGICPSNQHSGKKVNQSRMLRKGNEHLRKAMYMAALNAMRVKGPLQEYFLQLVKRGKCKKSALVCLAHKILRICFGIMKHGAPFKPEMA